MAYSFSWLYAALVLSLIFIVLATFISFFATTYIVDTTTSSTINANNTTARSMLIGAGILGLVIMLMLLFSFYNVFSRSFIETDPVSVMNARFSYGTFILSLLILLLVILMLFFMIYAITLIGSPTGQTGNAHGWVIAGAVMLAIAFIFLIISFFQYYSFNNYLSGLFAQDQVALTTPIAVNNVVRDDQPIPLGDIFFLTRNPATINKVFDGNVSLSGISTSQTQPIVYQGKIVENSGKPKIDDLSYNYRIEESQKVQPVLVQPVQTVVQPVGQPVLVNRPQVQGVAAQRALQQPVVARI